MKWKTFLSKYGLVFSSAYLVGFLLLVTFYSRFQFPTLPGDILITSPFLFYLPLVSSAAIAAFVTVMYEAYKIFKSF